MFGENRIRESAKGAFHKSLALFEKVIAEAAFDAVWTPDAYYMSAVGLSRLGDYAKAIEHHEKIVGNWPSHHLAWSSQNWIGVLYEKLKVSKRLRAEEADPEIEQAFFDLVTQYPECSVVSYALGRLGALKHDNGEYNEAVVYYEMYMKQGDRKEPAYRLGMYKLGESHEKLGNTERARELFSQFMQLCKVGDPLYEVVASKLK